MEALLSYTSVKLIRIYNPTLALIYYALSLGLLVYVIIYTVVLEKGYQEYDELIGSTMIKVKGSAHIGPLTNATVFDEYDLVMPPLQPDTVFIATNFILTPNQTRSTCEGNLVGSPGTTDLSTTELCNCSAGTVEACCKLGTHTENGMKLGQCGPSGTFCLMQAWCPLEVPPSDPTANILYDVKNFTVFVRVNIRFPNFDVTRSNTGENVTLGTDLFYVRDLVTLSAPGTTFEDVAQDGALLVVTFQYNCDLNKGSDNCNPDIKFARLDSPTDTTSKGFNYRYQWQTRDLQTNTITRDLWKVYGINIIFQSYGQAGRFSIVALTVTLGSGLAVIGCSTIICDLIMQYILPDKNKYVPAKYQEVKGGGIPNANESFLAEGTVSS